MYKNHLIALVIVNSLTISPLFASNIFNKFTFTQSPKKSSAVLKKNLDVKIKKGVNNFTDFSGTWVGKCSDSEEIETIVIENTDSLFIWDGEKLEIGSLETRSNANEENTSFSHILLEWNSNNTRLLASTSFFNYAHSPGEKNKIFGYGKGVILLKNNQLIMKFNIHASEGDLTSVCTYDKQQNG